MLTVIVGLEAQGTGWAEVGAVARLEDGIIVVASYVRGGLCVYGEEGVNGLERDGGWMHSAKADAERAASS